MRSLNSFELCFVSGGEDGGEGCSGDCGAPSVGECGSNSPCPDATEPAGIVQSVTVTASRGLDAFFGGGNDAGYGFTAQAYGRELAAIAGLAAFGIPGMVASGIAFSVGWGIGRGISFLNQP